MVLGWSEMGDMWEGNISFSPFNDVINKFKFANPFLLQSIIFPISSYVALYKLLFSLSFSSSSLIWNGVWKGDRRWQHRVEVLELRGWQVWSMVLLANAVFGEKNIEGLDEVLLRIIQKHVFFFFFISLFNWD